MFLLCRVIHFALKSSLSIARPVLLCLVVATCFIFHLIISNMSVFLLTLYKQLVVMFFFLIQFTNLDVQFTQLILDLIFRFNSTILLIAFQFSIYCFVSPFLVSCLLLGLLKVFTVPFCLLYSLLSSTIFFYFLLAPDLKICIYLHMLYF